MKLQADIGDEKLAVEIERRDGKIFANVDGRAYELEATEPEPGVFLFKQNGKVYEAFVSPRPDGRATVSIDRQDFDLKLVDPKRLRGSATAGETIGGAAEIKTAMPGKVVRILVSLSDEVKKGDGVIVVEAMKMQNEMKSPKDGVVKEIRVGENDTVGAGDVLVVIE